MNDTACVASKRVAMVTEKRAPTRSYSGSVVTLSNVIRCGFVLLLVCKISSV